MRATTLPGQLSRANGESQEMSMDAEDTSPSLRALLELCARYMSPSDLVLIQRAYTVAAAAHAGVVRVSGEPYIEHPLAVAHTLAELALDAHGIVAALLHDTVEDTALTRADVEREFGGVVARIVDGVTKITETELETPKGSGQHQQPEGLAPEMRAQRKRLERLAAMRK